MTPRVIPGARDGSRLLLVRRREVPAGVNMAEGAEVMPHWRYGLTLVDRDPREAPQRSLWGPE